MKETFLIRSSLERVRVSIALGSARRTQPGSRSAHRKGLIRRVTLENASALFGVPPQD